MSDNIDNSVARPWDEEMEPDYTGVPYMFDEPDEIDLYLQREHEEREELWRDPGEVWRQALREANGGLKALWDAEIPALARRQVG